MWSAGGCVTPACVAARVPVDFESLMSRPVARIERHPGYIRSIYLTRIPMRSEPASE